MTEYSDNLTEEDVEAVQALVDHEALQDREYLSDHLNEKLDAVRAAIAAMETSHDH